VGFRHGCADCARNCAREPAGRLDPVGRAHDVVAIEHAPRLVPADGHGHVLGDAALRGAARAALGILRAADVEPKR
jgi:hypothetical protein